MPLLWRLQFDGIAAPVLLPQQAEFLAALDQCITGWRHRVSNFDPDDPASERPLCIIEARPGGTYRAHSRFIEGPLDGLGVATAVCVILADLSQHYADLDLGHAFGLHCGGVIMNDRAIILAGEKRAGKSTLVARLACDDGVTVLSDDVLPIDHSGTITGLGLAPRLRLPLPVNASSAFRAQVDRLLGAADDRYGYLLTPGLAPHGRRAKAHAFILLDRRPDGPAALHHLAEDELLQAIIARSIAGPDGPEAVLDAAESLAVGMVGLRLVYSDLEEATRLLHRAFAATTDQRQPRVDIGPPLSPRSAPDRRDPAQLDPAQRLARQPDTAIRHVGGAAFLWRPGDAMLWHLNPAAQAIWALLDRSATANEITDDMTVIFPEVPAAQLFADTRQMLAQLCEEGFVLPAPPNGADGA
ncbi:PqqD family protein [Paragemmobacter ruber]|uniref:PqqD family peptide modification chaperone n=1 Tax=Paragemmobacter ruber TaxID=1985673 RepID=A0ABW9Y0V5_9RHOB|nr:PqqD family protein [Rhodobacter ruber]NBE06122.1 PqqD family peptide modification chaperone [Rhodobacter ruber]